MPAADAWTEAVTYREARPGTRFVEVLLADLAGIPRGKRLTIAEADKLPRGGFYLPGAMFALDVRSRTVEATGLGFDEGDADRSCLPVPGTLVPVPWLAGEGVAQVQVTMADHDGQPFYGDPRHVLARVLERFAALGLTPVVALELEFYLIDRQRDPAGGVQPPVLPMSGRREYRTPINSMADVAEFSPLLAAIDAACLEQKIDVGTALAEYGPAQFEVNLHHVADALEACDQAVRFKRLVKGVALQHGMEATFMAKPYATMPGSGAHIHLSLLDSSGRNVFESVAPEGSAVLRHAIGGLAATMAEAMLVFAPHANSYRRYVRDAYVPLRPAWAVNNRGVALRIPVSDAANRRLEHRVAGADVNPYLLTAVVLAGVLHGLSHELDPGEPVTGNAYTNSRVELPTNWPTALARFESSAFLREALGARFASLYCATRRSELEAFDAHVTPREVTWYAGL